MSNRMIWIHTLSPTHVGIGRGVGYVDLPIDRDSVTGWPLIRGSAIKGVWADHFRATSGAREGDDEESRLLRAAFGRAGSDNSSNAGALVPTDAQLVCLPVRSFRGTFAWVTSPLCLKRLQRLLTLGGANQDTVPPLPDDLADATAHCPTDSVLAEDQKIYLEDLDLDARACDVATQWAERIANAVFPDDANWQREFRKRFVVIPGNLFDFLCETATEVHTRVRIDSETKTVASGQLWTEEALPTETILAGLLQCERVFLSYGENEIKVTRDQLLDKFASSPIQLQMGGKATVGMGQVRCVFQPLNGGNK
ncbi:MAG: type III-B CRISPR module RAMP protein Cmr4 [Gemmatales bacterium]|nr:MAG: type III-B CRISPR module RAMP protein Cmr4 [Gemmatales bacterium]